MSSAIIAQAAASIYTQTAFNEVVNKIDNVKSETEFRHLVSELQAMSTPSFLTFIAFAHITPTSIKSKLFGSQSGAVNQLLLSEEVQQYCNRESSPISLSRFGSLYPQHLYLLPVHAGHNEHGALVLHIEDTEAVEHLCWYWSSIATYLVHAYFKVTKQRLVAITKRERDCLLWACEGKTSWEISQILGVSERTVNFHLANCIEKTNSANRLQAIAKCVVTNIL
ncbi:helix-turn-helix transcriptional regulator [Pseudoalteromonas sp. SMS1]|uniref:helix-turn-helix domain-containing protein n=1 Tax=Pseudoalteromonas sp. SMS1 TaxID=2908894 RepID=UPI001F1BB36E|nr:helix-turn-helix transcriptional regulator [Pseudoalteromonas sp. SMS1]MCF2858453.1 helix-turn-helix transcriptional regulator [Pseudoalteromonas sp. SMS1]